jgi:hypothetical protein
MSGWSVDRVLMAAVVGLGAYAVYRLVTAPKAQELPAGTIPVGTPSGLQIPAGSTAMTGDLLSFAQDHWYGARVELGAPDAPAGDLGSVLRGYGLAGARTERSCGTADGLYLGRGGDRTRPGLRPRGSRWIVGRWSLPSQNRPRPAWLPLVWRAPPPKALPA